MNKLKVLIIFSLITSAVFAQISPETLAKRERRKNLRVEEYNTDAKGKNSWLDHVTVYDDKGRKIEEFEYATYGMKQRIVSRYEDKVLDKVTMEIVYDFRNKPYRIRKYEYGENLKKKTQYNYSPSGKLYSVKQFKYNFEDQKEEEGAEAEVINN